MHFILKTTLRNHTALFNSQKGLWQKESSLHCEFGLKDKAVTRVTKEGSQEG